MIHYNFEWDPGKAKSNAVKHNIFFENAVSVFADEKAISIYDEDHSSDEDRWITMGLSDLGVLMVVSHTYRKVNNKVVSIRIISCRKATKKETAQYNNGEIK